MQFLQLPNPNNDIPTLRKYGFLEKLVQQKFWKYGRNWQELSTNYWRKKNCKIKNWGVGLMYVTGPAPKQPRQNICVRGEYPLSLPQIHPWNERGMIPVSAKIYFCEKTFLPITIWGPCTIITYSYYKFYYK
jgi:hypothetical protein